jgi:hypothetical protein
MYSSILSGWLTTGKVPGSTRYMYLMGKHHDGENRECDEGQDNDGGQCPASCECVHVYIPSFF